MWGIKHTHTSLEFSNFWKGHYSPVADYEDLIYSYMQS